MIDSQKNWVISKLDPIEKIILTTIRVKEKVGEMMELTSKSDPYVYKPRIK